jgi:hypothetical protein
MLREYPRSFGERFKENETNRPLGHIVSLCGCGNTFHRREWDKQKFCSQACIYRYSKTESQVFKEVLEAFAPAS